MLIILTSCLVIASILILCVKKNKETILIFGLSLSLMLEICGIMLFIAKKGGISNEVLKFFYFSKDIQNSVQYFMITLNQLGYMIAIGRTLFPFFLIQLSIHYSMIFFIRRNKWITKVVAIFPAMTLILYYPKIYRLITKNSIDLQVIMANISLMWISIYLLIALFLLIHEFKSISMKFYKRQFLQILICFFALTGLYCLYFIQDPGQVYNFYNSSRAWSKGVGYLQVYPSLLSYLTLVIVSVICCATGFYSLFHFTRSNYIEDREEIAMQSKFDSARLGASTFVHSIKNQLLASRVIYKRLGQLRDKPELDKEQVFEYIDKLEESNKSMLLRMDELYKSVKSNTIYLIPVSLRDVVENAIERFNNKYPNVNVNFDMEENTTILADKTHFSEALYNLLTNAYESTFDFENEKQPEISIIYHNERLYNVIEVRDNGVGMSKSIFKKIFEPFYTSRNSNYNWGMGLYYVRAIVKSHFGSVRVESEEGKGSSFFILLPKY